VEEASREEGDLLATHDGAHDVGGGPLPALKEKKEKKRRTGTRRRT